MSKLNGDSVTKQEAKPKEKDEQIKEMKKLLINRKLRWKSLKKPWQN
jgi:hypothetical protein